MKGDVSGGEGGKQGLHCSTTLQVILLWLQIKVEREAELSRQQAWYTCTRQIYLFPSEAVWGSVTSQCLFLNKFFVCQQPRRTGSHPGKLVKERHQQQRSADVRGWGRSLSWQRTNLNLMTTIFKNQSECSVWVLQRLTLAAYSVRKNLNVVCDYFFVESNQHPKRVSSTNTLDQSWLDTYFSWCNLAMQGHRRRKQLPADVTLQWHRSSWNSKPILFRFADWLRLRTSTLSTLVERWYYLTIVQRLHVYMVAALLQEEIFSRLLTCLKRISYPGHRQGCKVNVLKYCGEA